ncbi:MAG: gliding motility-associated C-terminal domain-containing protein, partial [Chitinophagaceae bacterium]|nr:gliding motility-associated C-terminal domain-containing protein [Chitinophagaceae bacterium]
TITVKDANNCTKTSTVSITQPNVLNVTASAGSILCNGGNTTITATGTGGTTSYQYSLNGGTYQAGTSFTNVVAGSYTVTIKDANNCTATTIVTITQPTLLTATASATAISCNAGQSTITVTANGGTTAYQYKLNAGAYQSSNIFSNNNAGTYTITVQDANNCTTTTTVSIVQPTALTLSSSATAILCNPGTSTITATAGGGTTAYQFSLNGGAYQSGNTFSGNGPGTYTITVKDANNCTKTSTVSITQPNVLSVTASAGSILCNGGNTTITATGTGGTTSYQYSLNGGTYQAGTSFTNVVAGSYTVTIKDANNCTATTIVTITQPTLLTATASATAISCNAGQSTITVTANGGTTAYQYKLNAGAYQASNIFSNNNAGTYTISVQDANNCTTTTTVSIVQPTALTLSASATAILCNPGTSTITATAGGGTTTYQYSLNGGVYQSGNTFSGNGPGTYTITVKDANNCTKTSTVSITLPPVLQITNVTSTIPTCVPGNDASLTVTASGGSGLLQYKLNAGAYQSSNQFLGLGASTYTITVKDANNCTVTSVQTISNPNSPVITNASSTPITCNGLNNGQLTVTASGSTLLTYKLLPNNITNGTGVYTNLLAGNYTVVVTDANNCSVTTGMVITQPALLQINPSNTAILCNGNYSTISVSTTGGTAPYQYNINGGVFQTASTFPGVVAGTYTLSVKDANNCTASSVLVINQPAILNLSLNASSILCNGGSSNITATATGGTAAYQYQLNGGAFQSSSVFNGLSTGTYTIVVKDANDCTKSSSITIAQPTPLVLSLSASSILCFGGTSTITATGSGGILGYQYSLNGASFQSSNIFTNNNAGTYTITLKDANNCTQSSVIIISQPTLLTASLSAGSILCNGNTTTLTASANGGTTPYQYSVNGGSFQAANLFNNTVAGTYTLTVKDGNNCTVSTTLTVTQPTTLTASASSTAILCNGGSAVITATDGGGVSPYQYSLNGGSYQSASTFSGMNAGTYTIIVKDANNCTQSTTLFITQPPVLTLSAASSAILCYGGNSTITLTSSGGTTPYQYSLNGGSFQSGNSFTNNVAGTYTLTVKDANNCSLSTTIVITQPTQLNVSASASSINCNGGVATITINASGGTIPSYQYSLNGAGYQTMNVYNNLTAGTYTVQVYDGNNCSVSTIVSITQPNALTLALTASPILCYGGTTTINATATGGTPLYEYKLNSGSYQSAAAFTSITNGSYTITVKDANNCTKSSVVTITQPPLLQITAVSATQPTCLPGNDATLSITATGGTPLLQYSLNGGAYQNAATFNALAAGTYVVTVKDANNCTVSTSILISNPNSPVITNVNTTQVTCNGLLNGQILVTASGSSALTYSLQPVNTTNTNGQFTNLSASNYTVVVSDVNNCSVSSVVVINQPPILAATVTSTPVLCYGNYTTISVNATGGTPLYSYQINGAAYQSSNQFPGVTAGTYTLQVKDANNCTLSSIYTVTQPAVLSLNLVADSILCFGGTSSITATGSGGTTAYQYSLNGSGYQTSNVFNGLVVGTYTVVLKDANDCTKSSAITIAQPSQLQVSASAATILCYGQTTTITITATGGAGGNLYSLNGSAYQSSSVFTGIAVGNYTATVKDANNCTASTVINISQPTQLQLTATSGMIACQGGTTTITATATGGVPAYQYSLNGSTYQNGATFSGLVAGTYTVYSKDINNCTATQLVTLNEPSQVTLTITANAILCNGGTITLVATATGGNTVYTYSLNNASFQTSNIYSSITAGTYTIVVKDGNNCSSSSVITITEPSALVIDSVQTVVPTCIPGNDATLQVFASGGSSGYTFSIGGTWQTSSQFTGLASGAYTVVVKDANGCTKSSSVVIVPPNSPVYNSVVSTDVLCFGESNGTLQVTASGGIGSITYTLQPGNMVTTNGSFTNLSAGVYTITAQDANNCTVSTSIQINQPNLLSVSGIAGSIACNGGTTTLTLTANGGLTAYQYNLNGGAYQAGTLFTGLVAGTYTIGVKDANNCTASSIVTINQPSVLTASVSALPILCYNGTTTLQITVSGATPAYQYSLNGGSYQSSATFAYIAAGSYTITVIDANNCTVTVSTTISQPTLLSIDSLQTTSPTCIPGNDGSIIVYASGGTTVYQYSSGGGNQLSNVLTGLAPSTYTILVTDANGCTATSSITINAPNAPTIASVSTNLVSCFGGNDGGLQVTATGGFGTITYSLQPGLQSNNTGIFSALSAGSYTVVASDANNCSVSTLIQVVEPTQLTASGSVTPLACFGGTSTLTITANGGTLPSYQYSLNGSLFQTNNVYSNLSAGTYTVGVYDGNNCSTQFNITISQPPVLTLNLSASTIACNGGSATITANASGGTGALVYSLNGSAYQSSNSFTNLNPGVYTVVVMDANNCTTSSSISIIQPGLLQLDSVQLTTPTCIPGNDGTVIVFASGGTPSYMYSAGGANQASNILTGLAAGNYTITVTDLNGCTITQSITLNSPSAPQIDSILVTDVTCFSGLDGTITTFASGGLGTLTYLLNPGASSNTSGVFASLNANTYTITVTDVNQCTVTSIATINEPAVLTTSLVATSIACYGGTAAITANANGGTQPYQYSLNGGALQSNAIFSGLPAATYTIMVIDVHNCTSTSTIQITEPTQVQLTLSANNIACNGGTSTITASASGGTSSYSYSLNGGAPQSSNVFTNITPGTYTVQVSDVNNCIATSTILITQPTLVQIDSSIYTTPTCIPGNDGTITVFASGGTPTYQYTAGGANQSSNVILGLSSGTFTITVTDLNGCTATAVQTILPPSAPIISSLSSTNISCFGGSNGSIQVSASGGLGTLTYLLTPGNLSNTTGNYSNLLATNYTVTVTDLNNCTVTTIINLTEPTPVQVVTSTADSVLCFGDANGSIQVVANGGTGVISYTLQPGNIVNTIGNFTNLTAGTYTVTGIDAYGCSTSTQLTVYSPAVLQFITVTHTDETCNNTQDASINATATGGSGVLTYSLQPGGQSNTTGIFTNLSGSTYTLVVTDAHACSSSTTIFIINPAAIALASLNHTDVLCAGNSDGTITATGAGGNPGGYTFTLQPGGSSNTTGFFNGLPTGTYTVTISDVKNCSASSTVVILTPSPINFVLNTVVDATCFGVPNGQVYTTITGGTGPFTYVIQPGGITNNLGDFTNVPAGTFTMTVTDANGCSSSVGPFTVNQPPAIVFNLISKKDVTCYGGSDGNFQISVNGGTGPKTLQLAPAIGTFTAPGFFDNLSSNTYTITATDGNGCTASSTVFINQNPAIVFDSIVLTSPTCHGDIDGKIHAFATGGSGTLYYQLNGGLSSTNGLFTGLSAATYTLSVNDQLGCLRDSIINLTEPDPIDFLAIDIKSAECGENKNGRIIITAMGGNGDYTYILRPYIRINKFGVFNDLEAGIYTITIKDYKGCLKDTVVEVNPPGSLMSLSIDKNNLGCFGTGTEGWAKVNVENGTPPYAYSWSTVPIQTSETATGLYFGYYFVDVIDARGCKQTDTVYIEPGPCCEEVFVPNAFSPNNDGVNDVFRVVTSAGIELIQFAIYNRWGNRVWSTPDFRRSWDGRDGGKIVDGNTYYYIFRYKCLTDGNTYIKKGDVTVMP